MHTTETIKALLAPWGELRPQAADQWMGNTPLPDEVINFYQQIGPWGEVIHESVGPVGCTLNVGGNPVCIPPLHKLFDLQAGYAWQSGPDEPLSDWHPNWLVIAEQGGDPFIYDTHTGQVLFAFHGAGTWSPALFAPDLYTAIGSLAVVANTHEKLTLQELNLDEGLTSEGRAKVIQSLGRFLGCADQADRMLNAWEYYA